MKKKKIPYADTHKHFCPCCSIIGPGEDNYGRGWDFEIDEKTSKKLQEIVNKNLKLKNKK